MKTTRYYLIKGEEYKGGKTISTVVTANNSLEAFRDFAVNAPGYGARDIQLIETITLESNQEDNV